MTSALVRLILITSAIGLASCEARPGARLELSVASDDAGVIRQTQAILYNRLRELSGGILVDVRTGYFPEMKKLVYEITAGAPSQEALEYLYTTRGEYRVFVAEGDGEVTDWITNQDIADADSGRASRGPTVFVGLSPLSARRVAEVSGEYIGTTVQSSLDGRVIYETTLTWPIQRFYQFEVETLEKAEMLAAVLKYGALPVEVQPWTNSGG
jgi:preprotein translocase subunit SecD